MFAHLLYRLNFKALVLCLYILLSFCWKGNLTAKENRIPSRDYAELTIYPFSYKLPSWCFVQKYIKRSFLNKWSGLEEDSEWPARSPDLTLLDFSCVVISTTNYIQQYCRPQTMNNYNS